MGELLGAPQRGTPEGTDAAAATADKAYEEWHEFSYIDRARCLWDIYCELRDRTEKLAEAVTRGYGKEISEGRTGVIEAYHMVEWVTDDARHPKGDAVPSEIPTKDAYMCRKPRDVVGCITPWSPPIAIPFWHMTVTFVGDNTVA